MANALDDDEVSERERWNLRWLSTLCCCCRRRMIDCHCRASVQYLRRQPTCQRHLLYLLCETHMLSLKTLPNLPISFAHNIAYINYLLIIIKQNALSSVSLSLLLTWMSCSCPGPAGGAGHVLMYLQMKHEHLYMKRLEYSGD